MLWLVDLRGQKNPALISFFTDICICPVGPGSVLALRSPVSRSLFSSITDITGPSLGQARGGESSRPDLEVDEDNPRVGLSMTAACHPPGPG